MLTVVTGASGHVGSNLVRALLDQGRKVRVLVRQDRRGVEGLDVEQVTGDVMDLASLVKAFKGAEVVYHLAANIIVEHVRDPRVIQTNVIGPRNVARACLENNVRRLVHCSSIHALSEIPYDQLLTEANGLCTEKENPLPYSRSKADGEREITKAIEQGLDAVIINPASVIGPYDFKPSRMGETIRDLATGRLPAIVVGAYDFVDVRDIVKGAIQAEKKGRIGQRYLLGGHYVEIRQLAQLVEQASGTKAPRMTCPMWLAQLSAPFATAFDKMRGKRPKFSSQSLRILRSNAHTDCAKAASELGHTARPLAQTIADTVAWQREIGWLGK